MSKHPNSRKAKNNREALLLLKVNIFVQLKVNKITTLKFTISTPSVGKLSPLLSEKWETSSINFRHAIQLFCSILSLSISELS